jgi:hypothetical protein
LGKCKEQGHSKDLGRNERISLEWVLWNYFRKAWAE